MSLLRLTQDTSQPQADLAGVYDAIVIRSGAAGGMAAHVLTSQGMQVLLLEAGRKLDIDKELESMEWPYDHPRRGDMPPGLPGGVLRRGRLPGTVMCACGRLPHQ